MVCSSGRYHGSLLLPFAKEAISSTTSFFAFAAAFVAIS
jgi:hypothetical protein